MQAIDREFLWHPFSPVHPPIDFPIIVRAKRTTLTTNEGKEIIDAISSWWVNLHGHSHSELIEAMSDQANKLDHIQFGNLTHDVAINFCKKFTKVSPLQLSEKPKLFFSDNGSTSIEIALKLARQYHFLRKENRSKIVAFKGGYHGDTWGCMNASHFILGQKSFSPYPMPVVFTTPPMEKNFEKDLEEFRQHIEDPSVGIFIYEPLLQGVAGMKTHSLHALNLMLQLAREKGIVCIADECFTGFGRTGNLFVSSLMKTRPDILCLAKGITGGLLPLALNVVSEKIWNEFAQTKEVFLHGHSYTANPIALRLAEKNLEICLRPETLQAQKTIEEEHQKFCNSHSLNARVVGTILAIDFPFILPQMEVMNFAISAGVLLRPIQKTLYLVPPYCITQKELHQCYLTIEKVENFLIKFFKIPREKIFSSQP